MEILQNWETVTIFLKLWGGSFLQVEGVMFIVILVLVSWFYCIVVYALSVLIVFLYCGHHWKRSDVKLCRWHRSIEFCTTILMTAIDLNRSKEICFKSVNARAFV